MQICRQLAGYSYGRADLVRRAMAKKKAAVMEQERSHFIYGKINEDGTVECVGAVANGVSEEIANTIFDEMSSFAAYAFNKSHAAAYAYLSYQTAYLKCHHKREYMAALLTSVLGNTDKVIEYTAECSAQGIRVLPPSVNSSGLGFSVNGKDLNFGLLAVKNLGRSAIENIVSEREKKGKFVSLYDFIERMYGKDVNKRAMESLIKCGAFDCFPNNRKEMLASYEAIADAVDNAARRNIAGQLDLFSAQSGPKQDYSISPMRDYSLKERLAMEKEVTGLFLSGHPLDGISVPAGAGKIASVASILADSEEMPEYRDGDMVTILCTVQGKKTMTTRNKSMMAFITAEDKTGSMEVVVFPNVYERNASLFAKDAILLIKGKISMKEEEAPKLLCETAADASVFSSGSAGEEKVHKKIYFKFSGQEDPSVGAVMEILRQYQGSSEVYFHFTDTKKTMNLKSYGVNYSEELINQLKTVINDQNIAVR